MKRGIALLLVVCACVALFGCSRIGGYTETKKQAVSGIRTSSGGMVFPSVEGTVRSFNGDIYLGNATEDGKHIVTLEKDGSLYVATDAGKTKIADDVRYISQMNNDAVVYWRVKADGKYARPEDDYNSDWTCEYERYTFATGHKSSIGEIYGYELANRGSVLLYCVVKETDTGSFYELHLLNEGEDTSKVVASSDNAMSVLGVSSDGSVYAWYEKIGSEEKTVYIFDNGEKEKVYTVDSSALVSMHFNDAENFAQFYSYSREVFAFWTKEGGITKVNMPYGVTGRAYTDLGYTGTYPEFEPGVLYVSTQDDDYKYNLYAVMPDGNREKLLNSVTSFEIRNEHLYYIDENDSLYHANLKNGVLSDERKIADDVWTYKISPDGSAAAYFRGVQDGIGALYYYKIGDEKPVRIETESSTSGGPRFSNDGSAVFYFTDPDKIPGVCRTGTLMRYDIGENESVRIGADVVTSISSEYRGDHPLPNGIWYYKFMMYDEDLGAVCDLMYWNGKEAVRLAKDVIY